MKTERSITKTEQEHIGEIIQPGEPTTLLLTEFLTTYSHLIEQLQDYDMWATPWNFQLPSLQQAMQMYNDLICLVLMLANNVLYLRQPANSLSNTGRRP